MPACSTDQTLPEIVSVRNPFLPVPDADFRNGLLQHAHRLGGEFHVFGLKDFRDGLIPSWLNEIDKL